MSEQPVNANEAVNQPTPSDMPAAEPQEEFVLTPEIMASENRRYDLIMAAMVLLFGFFLSAYTDSSSVLYLCIKNGQDILANPSSLTAPDQYSITAAGQTWVNPHWLTDVIFAALYNSVGGVGLVVFKSLLVVGMVTLLLLSRHGGSTQWWLNLCVMLGLVGISTRLFLGPEVFALFCLAGLLTVLFRGVHLGRPAELFAAIPIMLLWANLDISWPIGSALLLCSLVGVLLDQFLPKDLRDGVPVPPAAGTVRNLAIVTVVGCLAGLATPYTIGTWTLPYEWLTTVLPNVPSSDRRTNGWEPSDISILLDAIQSGSPAWYQAAWAALATIGFASFFLNYAALSVARLGWYGLALCLPFAVSEGYMAFSAMILAMVTALNGQEFFISYFGRETGISRGWLVYSLTSRGLPLMIAPVLIFFAVTGRMQGMPCRFGFGIQENQFMVSTATWLNEQKFPGNAFPFTERLANYGIFAGIKSFVDSRWNLFPAEVLKDYSTIRNKINENKPDIYGPLLDKYNITHIILDQRLESVVARLLAESKDLRPVWISDQAVVFARVTSKSPECQTVAKLVINPNRQVFQDATEAPARTDRFVMAPNFIDSAWPLRYVTPAGYRSGMALVNLAVSPDVSSRGDRVPGSLYLGLREFRNGIAANPDNPDVLFRLGFIYQLLWKRELEALLPTAIEQAQQAFEAQQGRPSPLAVAGTGKDGKTQTPAKPATPAQTTADQQQFIRNVVSNIQPINVLPLRYYQMVASFRNASIAGPMRDARLPGLDGYYLGQIYTEAGMIDAALDAHKQAYAQIPNRDEGLGLREEIQATIEKLDAEVTARREQFTATIASIEKQLADSQQGGIGSLQPIDRANLAMQAGMPLLALEQIGPDRVSALGQEQLQIAPLACNIHLRLGNMEQAQDKLNIIRDQPGLSPGDWSHWSALVRVGMGNYAEAVANLEKAITEIRVSRTNTAINGFDRRLRLGQFDSLLRESQEQAADIAREANMLIELGLLRIEMGEAPLAPAAFARALAILPRHPLRPVIGMYWKLITKDPFPKEPPPLKDEDEIARRLPKPPAPAQAEPKPETPKAATTETAKPTAPVASGPEQKPKAK